MRHVIPRYEHVSSFDRPNLRITVERKPSSGGVAAALAPLVRDVKVGVVELAFKPPRTAGRGRVGRDVTRGRSFGSVRDSHTGAGGMGDESSHTYPGEGG